MCLKYKIYAASERLGIKDKTVKSLDVLKNTDYILELKYFNYSG